MLVYANSFILNPPDGPTAIIEQVASWISQTRKSSIDAGRLGRGIRSLKLNDGATVSSLATLDESFGFVFPYFFCARLVHGQVGVPGRRWTTEVGISQSSQFDALQCSIFLKTDEISAKVIDTIQVTRPKIVQKLLETCSPIGKTPGLNVIRLTEENASGFAYEIEHESRKHPVVLLSCSRAGVYPVSPERLHSILMGLAQVIAIPVEANTFKIEHILGRRYSAFGGAVNIIFPFRTTDDGGFCKTLLLRPDQIAEIQEEGATIESDILATITHQTNLPHSWRHVSIERVSQALLASRLKKAVAQAGNSQELVAFEELLKEAGEQLKSKDDDLKQARTSIEDKDANLDQLRAEISGLKHALSGSQLRADVQTEKIAEALAPLRKTLRAVLKGKPTLEEALRLIVALFPERIVALNGAFESAKESDRGGFIYGKEAYHLLLMLAEEYWAAVEGGQGDQHAKAVFGKSFAAKESGTLSNDGRRRRTFNYLGNDLIMEKHLKIGVKDSLAETLRIHFEWQAEQKKIVIGHCGKHLDF